MDMMPPTREEFKLRLIAEGEQRRQYVLALYEGGKTTAEMCEQLGISRQRLCQILRRAGVKRNPGPPRRNNMGRPRKTPPAAVEEQGG